MSVYVGIDVQRKRSQVAVVTEDGTVQLNKNTVNGTEPLLRMIGDLPAGTPVAFEAAFGWGRLAGLLEDYGFEVHLVHPLRCKAIASARLKTRSTRRSWRSCCARTCSRKPGSRRARCGSSARCCGTGPASSASAPGSRHLRRDRPAARHEDRHHRDRPQAADARLAPAGRPARYRHDRAVPGGHENGRVAKPRARSPLRHEPAPAPRSII
jgi:hypothetical protein